MTQNELNRAVACATGETVSEIASRGFGLLVEVPCETDFEPIDWDRLEQGRNVALASPRNLSRVPR